MNFVWVYILKYFLKNILVVLFLSIFLTGEAKVISEMGMKFYNFSLYFTITTDNETPKISQDFVDASTFLSIEESLLVRNRLKTLLETDEEENSGENNEK